ncbi:MAG: hypothetical protein IPK60_11270 [Sandaracinaceae bacterium]|jgi:hypothetical protein|nr:hypothetical protein [Sandaracinaceae bacterium]
MDPVTPVEPAPPAPPANQPQFDPPRNAQMLATGMWLAVGVSIGAALLLHATGATRAIILSLGTAVVLAMNIPLALWIAQSIRAYGFHRRFVVYLLLMLARLSIAGWVFLLAEAGRLFASH